MKITVTVDNPTSEFQNKLLSLLAEHAAIVELDTTWTLERASRYYLSLPPRAKRIVREAVNRNGYVSANDLRDDENTSLRGHSGALTRAVQRGHMQGHWPEKMPHPIEPQGPGFGKVVGYKMPNDLVSVFHAIIRQTEQ